MRYTIPGDGTARIELTEDEVLTVRHCILEALEAPGEEEFLIRTGGSKGDAESLLVTFKSVSTALATDGRAELK